MSSDERETTFSDSARASERTVTAASQRALREQQSQRRSARRSRAAVETTRPRLANVDRAVSVDAWKRAWSVALRLADNDASRIVRERSAFVVRNARHEQSAR